MNPWDNDPIVGAAPKAASADAPWANDPEAKPLTVHGSAPSPLSMLPSPSSDTGALPDDTTIGGFNVSKANALTTRTVLQAAVKGVLGLPALADDAGTNAAYYGKKLLSKTGLVDAPDPANYGLDQTSFPATGAVGKIAEMGPDALGLRKPTTAKDRIVMAGGEGALGAAIGVGAGAALRMIPGAAGVAASLADAPVAQVASGALAGTAGQGLAEEGIKPGGASVGGLLAGALPLLALRGGQVARGNALTNTLRPAGQENAAARVLQQAAENPTLAAQNAGNVRTIVPGSTPSGVAAAGDRGLDSLTPHLENFENTALPGEASARSNSNNQARIAHMAAQGIGDKAAENAAYAHAGAVASAERPAVLNGQPEMHAGDVLDHFARIARDPNNTTGVRDMAQGARSEITGRVRHVQVGTDAEGNPIHEPYITPRALEAAKSSFGSHYSGPPTATTPSYVMNTRREVFEPGGAMDAFSHHIEQGAPGYQAYVDRQASLRDAADRLNFGNTLLDKTTDPYTVNGVPTISPTKFGNTARDANLEKALSPGNRMTMERMLQGPNNGAGTAIQNVMDDLERQQRPYARGTGIGGSATQPRTEYVKGIDRLAAAGVPLSNRVIGPLARTAAPLAGYMAGGPIGAVLGASVSGALRDISASAGKGAERASLGIQGALGRAAARPEEMARLLGRTVVERPGVRGYGRAVAAPAVALAKPGGAVGAMAPRAPGGQDKRKKKKGR